ncbi:MAG: NUDIX domain-containing protein [Kribbellaceae bacterium]|nr:NUDIX domain-containing protein [Kribbellaceae bacterium]
MRQHHFGVYARIRTAGRILVVRKTRGPYDGLLDLPGGRPEPGESWRQALIRELHEELGVRVSVTGQFTPFSFHVPQSSTGAPIDFHHHGVFTDVPPAAPRQVDSPDTAGYEWFDLTTGDPSRLSPLVREVGQVG